MKSSKKNINDLTKDELMIELIKSSVLYEKYNLTEDFCFKYMKYLNWADVFKYSKISEEFFNKNLDNILDCLVEKSMSPNNILPKELIRFNYFYNILLEYVKYNKISNSFIDNYISLFLQQEDIIYNEFKNSINLEYFSLDKYEFMKKYISKIYNRNKLSLDCIEKYKEIIPFFLVFANQSSLITKSFIDKYNTYFKPVDWQGLSRYLFNKKEHINIIDSYVDKISFINYIQYHNYSKNKVSDKNIIKYSKFFDKNCWKYISGNYNLSLKLFDKCKDSLLLSEIQSVFSRKLDNKVIEKYFSYFNINFILKRANLTNEFITNNFLKLIDHKDLLLKSNVDKEFVNNLFEKYELLK